MERIKNEFSTNNASGKNIQKGLNPDRWMPIEILKINILSLSSGLLTRLKKNNLIPENWKQAAIRNDGWWGLKMKAFSWEQSWNL